MLLTLVLLGAALLLERPLAPNRAWLPTSEPARLYAARALRTQQYSLDHLAFLAGSDGCGGTAFIGFGRNEGSPLSDAWYSAAQIQADAALVRLGQREADCLIAKSVAYLDLLARPGPAGGYYPRANVDGRFLATRDSYADDNALIGLAMLEARAAVDDRAARESLLRRAELAATFLTNGGVWDETFGGGFWWNTDAGRAAEGKPAQTTALATELFARLYEETGEPRYAGWAQAGLDWLDRRLLDPASGLYRYTVRHWDMQSGTGEYVEPRLFGYDQAIMIEVHLVFERSIEPRRGHLERARNLAEALESAFWEPELGGYRISTEQADISASYAAWISQALVLLYAADPDPTWLARARANLDALEAHLLDPNDGGYANLYFRCEDRARSGCEDGAGWSYDPTKYLTSQAWMQRAQALVAAGASGKWQVGSDFYMPLPTSHSPSQPGPASTGGCSSFASGLGPGITAPWPGRTPRSRLARLPSPGPAVKRSGWASKRWRHSLEQKKYCWPAYSTRCWLPRSLARWPQTGSSCMALAPWRWFRQAGDRRGPSFHHRAGGRKCQPG